MATAWIDERRENAISVARGVGRPVWLGTPATTACSSPRTKLGLEVVERFLGVKLEMRRARGRHASSQLERGREMSRTRFKPDRRFGRCTTPGRARTREAALLASSGWRYCRRRSLAGRR